VVFGHTQIPLQRFPSYFPVVTGILAVQTVLFAMMTLQGGTTDPEVLIRFGAYESMLVSAGEWWRLVTPVFLHIGWMHFLFNSFALYLLGPQLEWLMGRISFLLLYLACGTIGNLVTYWLDYSVITAGASGSIYGLFGVYLYLYWRRLIDPETGKGLVALVGINLLISLFQPNINLAAHLGGLLSGFLLTEPLLRLRRRS
jgi:rhomboid protease GluP